MRITEGRADALLRADLEEFERGVARLTGGLGLTENQFGALVSFAFNVGLKNLEDSRLLACLRVGQADKAANEFLKWTKARHPKTGVKRELPGLVRRRARERALFLEEPMPQVEVDFAAPSPELREFATIAPPEDA